MSDLAYYCSWIVTAFGQVLPISILLAASMTLCRPWWATDSPENNGQCLGTISPSCVDVWGLFPYSDPSIIFVTVFLYGMASSMWHWR